MKTYLFKWGFFTIEVEASSQKEAQQRLQWMATNFSQISWGVYAPAEEGTLGQLPFEPKTYDRGSNPVCSICGGSTSSGYCFTCDRP